MADRLRGWERVLDWRYASGAQRRHLLKRAIWMPVRAWKEAKQAVEKYGREVEGIAGVSPIRQRGDLWSLQLRHGASAKSYLDYQLYLPARRRVAGEFVGEFEYYRLLRWSNALDPASDARTFYDKNAFSAWCDMHALACVPTLLEYDEGKLVASTLQGDPASSLPRRDLFSKPADGTGGKGTGQWRYERDIDGWRGSDGIVRSAEGLLKEIAQLSATLKRNRVGMSRRILLQPRLRNHPALLPLAPRALSTVRILTCRTMDGDASTVLASFKMAVGDAPADNFCFGGVIAPVDIRTGQLGQAVRRRGRVLVPAKHHPDTGAPIAGHQLPFWHEAIALAERGLLASRGLLQVGWDVAITEGGPVLVEGNPISNPDVAQVPSGQPLTGTVLPSVIDAHIRRLLGA